VDECGEVLRADASRNRAALVQAAREVFAERGLDAPLDEIARRAGVGNATLYRRFPERNDLIAAVFTDVMSHYGDLVEKALLVEDPWDGFRGYVLAVLQLQAVDRGMADLLVSYVDAGTGELAKQRARAHAGLVKLIRRAKDAGGLREDFTSQDLPLILMANAGLVRRTFRMAPTSSSRVAAFILDGLQASAATPAPPAPREARVVAAMKTNTPSC
jgi:AcrR family transcriptional regulator